MKEQKSSELLYVLLVVPFIWALSNSMIIPILPKIQEQLTISRIQAGLIITALSIPTAILLPITGFLSDRFGRVNIMVPSIIIYGLGGVLAGGAGLLESYPLLLAARAIQGIGATGTTLLAMSFVGDLYQNNQRRKILGFLETTNSLGKLISPLIGTAAASIIWVGPFFIYPLLAFPTAILLFIFGRKTNNIRSSQSLGDYFGALNKLVSNKKCSLIAALSGTFIAIMIWFGNLFFLSEIMATQFNISGFYRGLLLSLPIMSLAVTALITAKYLKWMGLVNLTSIGLLIISLTLFASLILPQKFLIYGTVALVGIGLGLTLPSLNTLVISAIDEKERGVVSAVYGSIRASGSAFGPLLFGWAMDFGNIFVLLSASSLALIASLVTHFLIKESDFFKNTLD